MLLFCTHNCLELFNSSQFSPDKNNNFKMTVNPVVKWDYQVLALISVK